MRRPARRWLPPMTGRARLVGGCLRRRRRLLLVHDQRLLKVVDGWLTGIPNESFIEVLP